MPARAIPIRLFGPTQATAPGFGAAPAVAIDGATASVTLGTAAVALTSTH